MISRSRLDRAETLRTSDLPHTIQPQHIERAVRREEERVQEIENRLHTFRDVVQLPDLPMNEVAIGEARIISSSNRVRVVQVINDGEMLVAAARCIPGQFRWRRALMWIRRRDTGPSSEPNRRAASGMRLSLAVRFSGSRCRQQSANWQAHVEHSERYEGRRGTPLLRSLLGNESGVARQVWPTVRPALAIG